MTHLTKIATGDWKDILEAELTAQQRQDILNDVPGAIQAARESRERTPSAAHLAIAQQALTDNQDSKSTEFVACDVFIRDNGNVDGIINYRVGNKHKQIRF